MTKQYYVQDYIPIKDVKNGIIETTDGRFVKIIEVFPVSFMLDSKEERSAKITAFANWLKIAPVKVQFKIITVKADVGDYTKAVEKSLTEKCATLGKDYINLVNETVKNEAIKRRFFIVFEYVPVKRTVNTFISAVAELCTAAENAKTYLASCGNQVRFVADAEYFTMEFLYLFFNRKTSQDETLKQRTERVILDVMKRHNKVFGVDDIPEISAVNFVAPKGLDFTNTNAQYIKYVVGDSETGVQGCYVKMPGNSYYSTYASGMQLTANGTYYFYSVDKAGNESETVSITLDNVCPTGTVYGNSGISLNPDISLSSGESVIPNGNSTNAEYITFVPYDGSGIVQAYVLLPNTTQYSTYSSGDKLYDEGEYSFYSVDKAGNVSETYIVTVNRGIPAAQLYVDDEPVGNNSYTNGAHIKFVCDADCYVKLPDSFDFSEYMSGVEYHKPGQYMFFGADNAGNFTEMFTITIDRTVKSVKVTNVHNGVTDGDVTITWEDEDPEVYAPISEVTVNGVRYTKGEVIYTINTGVYSISCIDAAGNVYNTQFVSTKRNVLTNTLKQEYYEACDAEDRYFAFATYEAAVNFAFQRETSYVSVEEWHNVSWDTGIAMDEKDSVNAANGQYYIYKKEGDPRKTVAYFTINRLHEVMYEYAREDVNMYYYWEKTPNNIADNEDLTYQTDFENYVSTKISLTDKTGWKIDGVSKAGMEFSGEGTHVLTVFDNWGNECDYSVNVVGRAPEIIYSVGNGAGNTVTFNRTYYFKDGVTVSINDGIDALSMFVVYNEYGKVLSYNKLGETFSITESGKYTVRSVNHYGFSDNFEIIISKDAPKISIDETENKQLRIRITESRDFDSHIQMLEIYKSLDGGNTWTLLSQDDYGNVVSIGYYEYRFRTSGLYKAVVTDEFRTGIDAVTSEFDYMQKEPEGTLAGVSDGGYTSGDVSFTWQDEAITVLKKDGMVIGYRSGDAITENGNYVLSFENYDGYRKTYSFVIDNDMPTLYIKLDYNQDCGVGTENDATSFGEGLEKNAAAYLTWVDEIKDKFPDVLFETCSSGGMRMDYKTLGHFSIVSTSDQVDFKKYPYIVSNIFSAVLPEQGAVWGYPADRIDEKGCAESITTEQTIMNMINSFIGRMHLASPVNLLSEKCLSLVKEGIVYYKKLNKIKNRALPYFPAGFNEIYSDSCVFGLELKEQNKLYLAVWSFKKGKEITVTFDRKIVEITIGYPKNEITDYDFNDNVLKIRSEQEYCARFLEIEFA